MAKSIVIRETNLLEHPAVKAWGQLQPEHVTPQQISVLKQKSKSAVYRLAGLGPGGAAVIAKRSLQETAWIERTIYEEILPGLPLPRLQYYGSIDEQGTVYGWLFLEDAGGERYSPLVKEHRDIAARWLALMHTLAAKHPIAARLPDRGPGDYLRRLRSARETILQQLGRLALSPSDRAVLEMIVSRCDTLESDWDRVEQCCRSIPSTLVHGDFRAKNARIRSGPDGPVLLLLDWETAGWGVPAIDLAELDTGTYASVVLGSWPQVDAQTLAPIVGIGRIFQWLAAIDWESTRLEPKWMEKPMSRIRPCLDELSAAMVAVTPWES